jgi:hypothetical protein
MLGGEPDEEGDARDRAVVSAQSMCRTIATVVVLLLAGGLASCGGDKKPSSTPAPTPAGEIAIAPADRPACALLFARLQRVTAALQTSSELIAHSRDKRQLSHRIEVQQEQLERSARFMTGGPIPAPLAAAHRRLVRSLHAFARDFGRAKAPAARGDFQTASAIMTDRPVVEEILGASRTIEAACK